MIPKILSGEKKIESRWYRAKYSPWDKIKKGDIVYFKNSGEMVEVKVKVGKVLQFSDLNRRKVREILNKYGRKDELGINEIFKFFERFKGKKYCVLVFLESPRKIRLFKIDKTGFGLMSAWLVVENIDKIKLK